MGSYLQIDRRLGYHTNCWSSGIAFDLVYPRQLGWPLWAHSWLLEDDSHGIDFQGIELEGSCYYWTDWLLMPNSTVAISGGAGDGAGGHGIDR